MQIRYAWYCCHHKHNSFLITIHINMDDKAKSEVVRQRLNAKMVEQAPPPQQAAGGFGKHITPPVIDPFHNDSDDDRKKPAQLGKRNEDGRKSEYMGQSVRILENEIAGLHRAICNLKGNHALAIVVLKDEITSRKETMKKKLANNDTGETLADEGAWVAGSNKYKELGPLNFFYPDVLRVTRKAMHLQVDQKKVELRNLGMEVPDDLTILKGLDTWSLFGFINEALEKDPTTNLYYQQL